MNVTLLLQLAEQLPTLIQALVAVFNSDPAHTIESAIEDLITKPHPMPKPPQT
jgi:hypothetical protein